MEKMVKSSYTVENKKDNKNEYQMLKTILIRCQHLFPFEGSVKFYDILAENISTIWII